MTLGENIADSQASRERKYRSVMTFPPSIKDSWMVLTGTHWFIGPSFERDPAFKVWKIKDKNLDCPRQFTSVTDVLFFSEDQEVTPYLRPCIPSSSHGHSNKHKQEWEEGKAGSTHGNPEIYHAEICLFLREEKYCMIEGTCNIYV